MALTKSVAEIVAQDTTGLLRAHPSWQRIALREVAEVLNGYPFDSAGFNADTGMPLARIRDVVAGSTSTRFDGPYDRSYVIADGDLLVGMDGDFNCARCKGGPALLNQRVCKISVDGRLYEPRLLAALLPAYLAAINAETSSVTVKHLSSRTIEDICLPLPPRVEQARLADKLDELLGDLDSASRDIMAAKRKLALYRRSLLTSVVQGTLTMNGMASREGRSNSDHDLPAGWRWASVEQVCRVVAGYAFPSQSFIANGTPVVKIADVGHGNYACDAEADHLDASFEVRHSAFLVEPGDLLIALTRPITNDTLKSCLYPVGRPRALLNQRVAALRPFDPDVAPYLFLVTRSDYFRDCMARAATQTLQPNVSPLALRSILVPIPPPDEIVFIAEYVSRELSRLDRVEADVAVAITLGACQRQNILRAAFSGQLVPQDPNDEPASVLISRIAQARAAASPVPRRRRPRGAKEGS